MNTSCLLTIFPTLLMTLRIFPLLASGVYVRAGPVPVTAHPLINVDLHIRKLRQRFRQVAQLRSILGDFLRQARDCGVGWGSGWVGFSFAFHGTKEVGYLRGE